MKTRGAVFIFCLVTSLAASRTVAAAEIREKDNRVTAGQILDEDKQTFYVETSSGIVTIKKSDIAAIDGKAYDAPAVSAASDIPSAAPAPPPVPSVAAEKWAVRVGSSGLTRHELAPYTNGVNALERHQHLSGLDWGTADVHVREAIEDEIVFQEALAAGTHASDPEIRRDILKRYEAQKTLGGVSPHDFSAEEMRAFYEGNKKEFMRPARYHFRVLVFNQNAPPDTDKARSDPGSVSGWRDAGWLNEEEDLRLALPPEAEAAVYRLRRGGVSEVISDGFRARYLFWCVDYQPAAQKTYDESLERVRHLLLKQKQSGNAQALKQQLGGGDTSGAMWEAALKAGTHRDRFIRSQIINEYLHKTRKTVADIVRAVKDRYPVEINTDNGG